MAYKKGDLVKFKVGDSIIIGKFIEEKNEHFFVDCIHDSFGISDGDEMAIPKSWVRNKTTTINKGIVVAASVILFLLLAIAFKELI